MNEPVKQELPAFDIAEEDRQRAKNYARARFGSAVVSEACTFEKELRTDYHNQIREFIEEAEKRYFRERQLRSALAEVERLRECELNSLPLKAFEELLKEINRLRARESK